MCVFQVVHRAWHVLTLVSNLPPVKNERYDSKCRLTTIGLHFLVPFVDRCIISVSQIMTDIEPL